MSVITLLGSQLSPSSEVSCCSSNNTENYGDHPLTKNPSAPCYVVIYTQPKKKNGLNNKGIESLHWKVVWF